MKFHSLAKALASLRSTRKSEGEKGETDSVSDSVIHDTSILRSMSKLGAGTCVCVSLYLRVSLYVPVSVSRAHTHTH
jgi:hypothetical protein